MSGIRVAIEWTFGTIVMLFKFVKGQKIFESPCAKHYIVAVLLANCHCCLYGDQHTTYFDCVIPTLEEYLDNLN